MFYRLHGFRVVSDQAIPGLPPSDSFDDADLAFRFGADPFGSDPATTAQWFQSGLGPDGRPGLLATRARNGDFHRLAYSEGITFTIDRSAGTVWIDWTSGRSIEDTTTYLLGPIIGLVLRLRGITSLHASAVEIADRAIVFAGPPGAGKSTTAGALAVVGVSVLADDTVALRSNRAGLTVSPAYPRLRLWPEAAESLAERAGQSGFLPPGVSGSTRRYHLDLLSKGRSFRHEPAQLGLVYLIGDTSDANVPAVTSVEPPEALIALVGNTYANQFLDRDLRAREFDVLAQLVAQVQVRRLTRPVAIDHLASYCEFVLEDLDACGFSRLASPLR